MFVPHNKSLFVPKKGPWTVSLETKLLLLLSSNIGALYRISMFNTSVRSVERGIHALFCESLSMFNVGLYIYGGTLTSVMVL